MTRPGITITSSSSSILSLRSKTFQKLESSPFTFVGCFSILNATILGVVDGNIEGNAMSSPWTPYKNLPYLKKT
jgi:hypothetical protein